MSFHTYTVQRDGSHTCIVVAVERKYTYFIPMEPQQVRVAQLSHEEFRTTYDRPFNEYPVRRAAEIYLAAPDKEVTPKAREHLEAILADPAYVYDSSLYPVPNVIKESIMAKKNAAAVAEEIASKPKNKKEAQAQAGEIASRPPGAQSAKDKAAAANRPSKAKTDEAAPAKKEPKPKTEKTGGTRAPALDTAQKFKCGDGAEKVRAGFMLEFLTKAQELEKASRGKGFTGDSLLEAAVDLPGAAGRDAAWIKTYLSYGAAPARSIFVAA